MKKLANLSTFESLVNSTCGRGGMSSFNANLTVDDKPQFDMSKIKETIKSTLGKVYDFSEYVYDLKDLSKYPDRFVRVASKVFPEYKEYEGTVTQILNFVDDSRTKDKDILSEVDVLQRAQLQLLANTRELYGVYKKVKERLEDKEKNPWD